MEPELTPETTVATIATSVPGAASLFEQLGIDYCCGGTIPLGQACRKRGLDPAEVIVRLEAAAQDPAPGGRDWAGMSLADLTANIESAHHQYLKDELPHMRHLSRKVAKVHGEAHPELRALSEEFERFADDMTSHMEKEERVLFPLIRSMEAGRSGGPIAVDHPIRCLMHEHEDAGRSLAAFRSLTGGFSPPMGACNSWRVLLNDLERLERDTHEHVHKENNILFPRALALDAPPRGAA
ncbi:MAG TPA: iron-sulfur cluster repair di-iron protein [Phycisphaerales bacterium]|nr:iron-sulfur cluster repair di-iron protein [Phycisphaerales bacterium]